MDKLLKDLRYYFQGNDLEIISWFNRPHKALGDKSPLYMLVKGHLTQVEDYLYREHDDTVA